ncbi:MAG: site-2 protease family protein [Chloroflexi bacterium]|jgi:Zn-dependent protease|nr:site-2 protease family protein [Chloroflexota bacterium]MBT7082327.1 site-2 protease family protein [Chloroflexota bacterium]MBT7290606.1 site-2 protease family protein [Chloroflexota bacterium]
MKGSIKIGRILGIPIYINYTWLFVFAFITYMLAVDVFPSDERNFSQLTYWLLGICTSLLFFASLLLHELAHSFVCLKNGIPVKSITLFIFGGVARIAKEAEKPSLEFLMAAAGPFASIALSAIFGSIWWFTRGVYDPLSSMTGYLAIINLGLAIFNLVPGYPLDGGRIFRSIVWLITGDHQKATRIASQTGKAIGYLFIAGGVFIIVRYNMWEGLWIAFVGWFLTMAAAGTSRQATIKQSLGGIKAGDVMVSDYISISSVLTLKQVHVYIAHTGKLFFLVTDHERLLGSISVENFARVPQQEWDSTTVGQIMTPVNDMQLLNTEDDALGILEKMDEVDDNRMVVVDGHNGILGLITRDSLLRFALSRRQMAT